MSTETADPNIEVLEQFQNALKAAPDKNKERINAAFDVAIAYVDQIPEPGYQKSMVSKLTRSYVHGSRIEGIQTYEDVRELLNSVTEWKIPITILPDDKITVLQGELPDKYKGKAYAAYVTIREIFENFGTSGVGTIQARKGYQKTDDYYLCTMLSVPTDVVTVQLKKDESGVEHLKQWFAGREKSSIYRADDGDIIVRCNSKIPYQKHGNRFRKQRQ